MAYLRFVTWTGVALLGLSAAPAWSKDQPEAVEVDFTTIERQINKEPAYNAPPLYALFLLDPAAKVRVWAVLDKSKADLPYYDVLTSIAMPTAT